MRKISMFLMAFMLLLSTTVFGQLTGTKTIPGDYATLTAAIADLNTQGVGSGGVTFNVAAGYTETITAPLSITATGTLANPILFQKSGAGANPLITAFVGTATPASAVQDGIWNLVGSDYVTIDGIDLTDPNSTNPATMEYGFAMFKASITDGCQYNTIKNCVVTLSRVNNVSGTAPSVDGSKAINVLNSLAATQTTVAIPTSASGANSYNKFYSNTLQNCNYGIVIIGYAGATPFTLCDYGNDIGGTSLATGNNILNYGGATAAVNPAAGIRTLAQYDLNVSYNTVNNNNGSGVNHPNTLRGIYVNTATSANTTITNNILTISSGATTNQVSAIENASGSTAASNTVNINNNTITGAYTTATTGAYYGILNSGSPAILNANNNTISSISTPGTGGLYGIVLGSPSTLNVNSNNITGLTKTGIALIYGIQLSTATITCQNNIIDGLNCTAASSTAAITGIHNAASAITENYLSNIVRNLSSTGTATLTGLNIGTVTGNKTIKNNQFYNFTIAGGGTINGVYMNYGSTDTISNNSVYGLSITGATAGTIYGLRITAGTTNYIFNNTVYTLGNAGGNAGFLYGIYVSTGSNNVYKNKVYDLSSGSTGPSVNGIYISGGTTNNVYNNFISDLKAPAANLAIAIAGIYVSGGTTDNLYYNTVYLNATSTGALFGTTGIYASTTPTLDMRNNILVNTSTPVGANGYTTAYRRSTATLTSYAATSNNNCLYAGTPGTNNVVFYDGTTTRLLVSDFKTLVSPKDGASFSENVPFVNAATAPYDLHVNTATASYCESGGIAISTPIAITDDIDGTVRGATPDVGADEFAGTAAGVINPAIAASVVNSQQISLAITPNVSTNNIVIVWNTTGTFTAPSGVPPTTVGDPFAGGSFLYNGVTSPVVHSGLTLGTTYYYKAFSYDGANYSAGVTANATTNVAAPVAFTATAFSISQINLVWTKNAAANNVVIATNSTSTFGAPVNGTALNVNDAIVGGGTVIYNGPLALFNHTSLTAATTYYYKAWSVDTYNAFSATGLTANATTPCAPEVAPTAVQDFATYTGSAPQPICWTEATGALGTTTTLTIANSEWLNSTGFANTGTNVGVKTNLYSTGNEWIISQPIDLGATAGLYRVSYKYAVTNYNGTTAQTTLGTHKVNVVVSTDGGATWSNTNSIKEYTGAATYSNTGVTETINLTGYSGVVKIAFVATTTATSPDIDFHIDDFKVEAIPSCNAPTAGTATALSATGATLGWTAGGTETLWNVEYGVTGFTQGTGTIVNGVTNPYAITGLTQSTTYQFYVKADCGGSGSSTWAGPFSFTTPQTPAVLPYAEGFETWPDNWSVVNGTQTNKWAVGTAVFNTGAQSAYVSNNSGTSNAYTLANASTVHIYRDITFPAGVNPYTLKFNWKGGGESTYDYLKVYLVPITTNPVAGTELTGQLGTYNLQTTWQTTNLTLANATYANQTWRLIFSWINDNGVGTQPPIAIDDIAITELTCAPPTALTATALTATGATLGWTAGSTETLWNVEYGVTGFTQGTGTIVNGVTNPYAITGLTQNTTYQFYVKSDCGGSGTSTWAGPFSFTTPYSCPKPTLPTVTNITTTSAQLGWTNGGSETAWIVYYKTAADANYTEVPGVTTNPYTLSGLTQATSYIFKVKANCSVSDTSFTSATQTFTTACDIVSVFPYVENFEATTLPNCWSETRTPSSTYGWASYATGYENRGLRFDSYNNAAGNISLLKSPTLNISSLATAQLRFWWKNPTGDNFKVLLSTDGGATFPNTLADNLTAQSSWVLKIIDISSYIATGSNVVIGFEGLSNWGSGDAYIYLDKLTVGLIPTCEAPTALTATSITSTGATLGWTAGGTETLWNVEYGVTGFTQGTGTTVTGVANPYAISGLNPNTTYQFYVKSDCGGTGLSSWAGPFSFTTACGATASFNENFDGVTAPALPSCWSNYVSPSFSSQTAGTYATSPYNAPNCVRLYNSYATLGTDAPMLISPVLSNLNAGTNQIRFYAKGTTVIVGTMSDPANSSTFTAFQTVTLLSTSAWNEYSVSFASYAGTDQYIAFRHPMTSTYSYVYLDNIAWETIPTCFKPTALTASSITASDATISWTRGATETAWNVEYGPVGFVQGTGTALPGVVDTAYALADLTANTSYSFYVQADCGIANGQSTWAGPYTFKTFCNPVSVLPWTEGFETGYVDATTVDGCWSQSSTTGSGVWKANNTATDYNRTPRTGTWNATLVYGNEDWLYYQFSLNAGTSYTFEMYTRQDMSTYSYASVKVAYGTAANVASMTNVIIDSTAITNGDYQLVSGAFTPATSGLYFIGIKGKISGTPYYISIDDLKLDLSPSCLAPTALNVPSLSTTGATLAWTAGASETQWNVEYGAAGYIQGTGTTVAATTNSTTISGLTANTSYQFYVQANCGGTDGISSWTGPYTFYTGYCTPAPTSVDNDGITNVTFSTVNNTITAVSETYGDYSAMVGDVQQSAIVPVDITYGTGYTYDTKIWIDWNNDLDFNDAGEEVYVGTSLATNPTTLNASFTVPATAPLGHHKMRIGGQDSGPAEPCYNDSYGVFEDYTVNVTSGTTVCSTPTALAATNIGETTADLGWTSTAANFNVRYRIVGAATWSVASATSATLPLAGLTANTQYEFEVQAVCSATAGDTSAWAAAANFTTIVASACATPTALAATNITLTTADLGWTSTAANFNVRYRIVGGTTWTTSTVATTTLPLTGLAQITQYEFQVQAICSATAGDTSNWTSTTNFTTLSSCATPTALAATNIAQTTATLGWTSTAANFNVRYRTVGSSTWTNTTASAITLPVTGLTANTQYEFQVQATCSATVGDTSAWATAVTFTTLAMPACATPTALAATNVAQTTATLGWTSTAANFNVRYRTVGSATWTPTTASAITVAVTGLTANTQYEFQVQAVCSATAGDTSAWATAATFTTLAVATCPEPTALVVSAISEVGATLNWTAGGTETAWNLRYKKVADATYTNVANTSTKPYILTALQPSTAYVWNVQAVCSGTLTSIWSADNNFTTTVGIESNSLSALKVYSYENQVNVINNGNLLVKEVVIYDVLGQEVGKFAINSTDNILINTNLTIGNYVVKVITAQQVGTYKLFIK
jgi:hypothetical protein